VSKGCWLPVSEAMTSSKSAELLSVRVVTPVETFYNGPALSLTANNAKGQFDVLPGHAKFIALLTPGDLVFRTSQKDYQFPLKRGLIYVSDDDVLVLANF